MKTNEERLARVQTEVAYGYNKWIHLIPPLHFKQEWSVRIIPPFCGAIARFWIDYNDRHISCYLDCYDELGFYGEPYWEIYPYQDDVWRCGMMETEKLIEKITEALEGNE